MFDAFLVAERLRVQEKQYQDLLNNKVDVLVGTNVPTSQINQVRGEGREEDRGLECETHTWIYFH